MNVIIIFNKKKISIDIHKLDSILKIKNIVNKRLFNESKNLEDIDIYYKNKLLKNDDYCDKYNLSNESLLNIHLKKKGGNNGKKIMFYIGCIITILIPFFILPTGINTGGITLLATLLGKVKDEFSRFMLCELKYRTLNSRLANFIGFIKYVLFIMATYTLITIGCITACLIVKGAAITDDPNKICMPYYVGSMAGLILTVIYFFIYFMLRFGDAFLKPIEMWSQENFLTNLIIRPIIKIMSWIITKIKYVMCYFMPFGIGIGIRAYHSAIDNTLPSMVMFLDTVAEIGCSDINVNNLIKTLKKNTEKMKKSVEEGKSNTQNEDSNQNNNKKDDKTNKKINLEPLYKIQYQNGFIDHQKYDDEIEKLRKAIKPELHPLCKENPEGSCCQKSTIKKIADSFYHKLKNDQVIVQNLKQSGLYLGALLGIQGMYEKVLFDDRLPFDFEGQNLVKKKILLKIFFQNNKEVLSKSNNNNEINLLNEIEQIIVSEDTKSEELFTKYNMEKKIFDYLHKDDIKNENEIIRIKTIIAELEEKNKKHAEVEKSKYIAGQSVTKTLIKQFFINGLCNIFTTSKSGGDIVNQVGGLNSLIDILKCGSAAGSIMALIYIIVVIILIICGFFNFY